MTEHAIRAIAPDRPFNGHATRDGDIVDEATDGRKGFSVEIDGLAHAITRSVQRIRPARILDGEGWCGGETGKIIE